MTIQSHCQKVLEASVINQIPRSMEHARLPCGRTDIVIDRLYSDREWRVGSKLSSMPAVLAEKPHIGCWGVPFMKRTTRSCFRKFSIFSRVVSLMVMGMVRENANCPQRWGSLRSQSSDALTGRCPLRQGEMGLFIRLEPWPIIDGDFLVGLDWTQRIQIKAVEFSVWHARVIEITKYVEAVNATPLDAFVVLYPQYIGAVLIGRGAFVSFDKTTRRYG